VTAKRAIDHIFRCGTAIAGTTADRDHAYEQLAISVFGLVQVLPASELVKVEDRARLLGILGSDEHPGDAVALLVRIAAHALPRSPVRSSVSKIGAVVRSAIARSVSLDEMLAGRTVWQIYREITSKRERLRGTDAETDKQEDEGAAVMLTAAERSALRAGHEVVIRQDESGRLMTRIVRVVATPSAPRRADSRRGVLGGDRAEQVSSPRATSGEDHRSQSQAGASVA
jgi:hypothetical protein